MFNEIKEKIKEMIGRPQYITPICDQTLYGTNANSFAGNSLHNSNVLVVTNLLPQAEKISKIDIRLKCENCESEILFLQEEDITVEQIHDSGQAFTGEFDHIINLVYIGDENNHDYFLLTDPMKSVYRLLQQECDYLIGRIQYATICTAILKGPTDNISRASSLAGMESLIKGLGGVMAKKGPIVNGLSANESISFEDVLAAAVYLSSKYGQILAGEVLRMNI
ncbi:MAG: hypothetical protein J1E64_02190 [Acetatifactor sp.]|nr:hypothetical protein [Acetatifactor sp.]